MLSKSQNGGVLLESLHRRLGISDALAEEQNMLIRIKYAQRRADFLDYLWSHTHDIEAIVSYHLNSDVTLEPVSEWIHGSFNICLPICVKAEGRRAMIRLPLPYKLGEEYFPGNVDEKLRCEAATYIWIQQNCPDVPIPQLLGFAFSGSQCVGLGHYPIQRTVLNFRSCSTH